MTEQPLSGLRPPQAAGLPDDTLEEINRLWTVARAFSNTAHDVNNALQVIAGSAELLEARDLDPAVRRRIETIRAETGKAAATINRLLSYARAPRQAAVRLDVWPLIDTAVSLRTASVARGRISLVVERADSAPVWVDGEGAKILQTLLNMLLEAEDRIAGCRGAQIVVGVQVADAGVRVHVASSFKGERLGADQAPDESPNQAQDERTEGAGSVAAVMAGAQLWAAAYVASTQGGRVMVDGGTFTVLWRASEF